MMILFAVSAMTGVLGNLVVYIVLIHRGVTIRHLWAGTPGYLYRLCVRNEPEVGVRLRRMAFVAHVALIASFLLVFPLFMFQVPEAPNLRWSGHTASSSSSVGGNR
jgi:hypothetical protein